MKEVMFALTQNPVGISIAILMVLAILTFAIWYSFYVIYLPVASLISVVKIKLKERRLRKAGLDDFYYASIPQVGLTMADGGNHIRRGKTPEDEEETPEDEK